MKSFIICSLVCTGCYEGDHYNRAKYGERVCSAPGKISNAYTILFVIPDCVERSE